MNQKHFRQENLITVSLPVVKIILLVSGPKGKDVQIGYYGERLVLKAQELGLNTCWVAMSYNKIDLGIVRYHFETVSGHKVL